MDERLRQRANREDAEFDFQNVKEKRNYSGKGEKDEEETENESKLQPRVPTPPGGNPPFLRFHKRI